MADKEENFLSIIRAGSIDRFEADEPGVLLLKEDFRDENPEYLFLRKGEDFGGFAIMLLEALERGPEAITSVCAAYQGVVDLSSVALQGVIDFDWKEFLACYLLISKSAELAEKHLETIVKPFWDKIVKRFKRRSTKTKKDLRLLCSPDERNERARIGYEALGYQVRHYPKKGDAGSHRLYISSKRYALFYRAGGNRFFGVQGRDKGTITRLAELFEQEWALATIPSHRAGSVVRV